MTKSATCLLFIAGILCSFPSKGQAIRMSEVLIVNHPELKNNVSADAFKKRITTEIAPAWNQGKAAMNLYLCEADRGKDKGRLLLVLSLNSRENDRHAVPAGNPFTPQASPESKKISDLITNPQSFSEYHLLGAEKFESLPDVAILGIHYLKVKPDRAGAFEEFVTNTMHASVGNLTPDMHLLTYKTTRGDNKGSYITIFAIKSIEARDSYWPLGKPETGRLKQAFAQLQDLSLQLKDFLVEGSYLEPSQGAAAIFESKEWTDYVLQPDSQQ